MLSRSCLGSNCSFTDGLDSLHFLDRAFLCAATFPACLSHICCDINITATRNDYSYSISVFGANLQPITTSDIMLASSYHVNSFCTHEIQKFPHWNIDTASNLFIPVLTECLIKSKSLGIPTSRPLSSKYRIEISHLRQLQLLL